MDQIQAQMRNPRELSHAFHKGTCEDYHSMLAGIVLGVPFQIAQAKPLGLLPPPNPADSIPQYFPTQQRARQIIDGRTGRPMKEVKYLKFPG